MRTILPPVLLSRRRFVQAGAVGAMLDLPGLLWARSPGRATLLVGFDSAWTPTNSGAIWPVLAGTRHGVAIQVYLALIASILIVLWTGHKPRKATFEMLCWYFQGWATEAELMAHLRSLNEPKKKKA